MSDDWKEVWFGDLPVGAVFGALMVGKPLYRKVGYREYSVIGDQNKAHQVFLVSLARSTRVVWFYHHETPSNFSEGDIEWV